MEVKINVEKKKDFAQKAILVLLLVLVAFLAYLVFKNFKNIEQDKYYAVYLRTGDLYFGKISWFPKFTLKDVWFLQRATDNSGQVSFNLVKFSEAIYNPVDQLEINKDNVVWVARIDSSSPLIQEIKRRKVTQSPLPTSVIETQPSITTTTTTILSPSFPSQ
ncbi:MAG: hypothetical protein AB7D02_00900 [Candidatus Paceibacterota bacterium]